MNHQDIEIEYDLSDSNSKAFNEMEIGKINLLTGKIVASDVMHTTTAFSRTVEPGEYPVTLCTHEISPSKYIVEYAKIKFKPEEAKKWLLAVTDEMDLEELKTLDEDGFFGHMVSAGLSCFMDQETEEEYAEKTATFYNDNPSKDYFKKVLLPEIRKTMKDDSELQKQIKWNDHKVDEAKNKNIIMFTSGWGDGYYPAYWGYNDSNETVELTIDFLIADTYWNHHDL